MNLRPHEMYHIYNQGNNKELIFYSDQDYLEFLRLFRKLVFPHCKVLAYCLMPNHFHFLVYANEESTKLKRVGNINSTQLSNGFRLLQSSFAQYINKINQRSGSLFRQKVKAKSMSSGGKYYQYIAFHYIHQNPLKAGLVARMEDWHYSSFADFAGLRNGTLCDRTLAERLVEFNKENFIREAYETIDEKLIQLIFN